MLEGILVLPVQRVAAGELGIELDAVMRLLGQKLCAHSVAVSALAHEQDHSGQGQGVQMVDVEV